MRLKFSEKKLFRNTVAVELQVHFVKGKFVENLCTMFQFKSIFPKLKADNEIESGQVEEKQDAGELVNPQAQLRVN